MNNKKIIIFNPLIGTGGVEKNLFIITNRLSQSYKKVSIISTSNELKYKFDKKVKFISPKHNFWNKTSSRNLKILICLILLIKQYFIEKKFSVLSFQGNMYCCVLCKFLNLEIILRSNASITGWSKGFIQKILFKKISKLADKIVVNSIEFQKEYKKILNIDTICIYNPLNKKQLLQLSKKKIKIPFFKSSHNNFVNIGRLVTQKNQIIIIKALKLLKQKTNYKFKLLIIGSGAEKKNLEIAINRYNLRDNIKILSFQKNPFPYLNSADALILSSIYEGLPNVLLESLALQKFVISSDCPTGPSEILDKGKGGFLFKVNDEYDLYKKIISYIKQKKRLNKLVNFGLNRLYRFDYYKNLDKYDDLFKT